MRKLRVAFMFLIAIILVISAPMAAFAAPSDGVTRYGRTILQTMSKSKDRLCVYDRLVENCGKAEATIDFSDVSIGLTDAEIHEAFEAFHSDYPEYFWVPGEYSTISKNDALFSMTVTYTMSGSKLSSARAALEKKVGELTAGLNGKSNYEKSLLLHDRLAQTTAYVEGPNNQNAYGALVEGEAWCTGYAKAYQYLLLEVGIPSWIILGSSTNPATGVDTAHAWNAAKIDGQWYYTDVTWDDQGENLYHAYFNLTSAYMAEKHKASSFKNHLPKATATAANYFAKNNGTYSKYDADAIAKALKAGNNTAHMFVTGDLNNVESFYKKLNSIDSIKTIVGKMGAPAGSGFSYSLRKLGHEVRLTVNIIAKDHKHKISKTVQPVAPSCMATGHQGYYACSCGKWFSDTKAQNEITNKDALIIPALAHKASGWKSNATEHWKVCKNNGCGTEIANTRSAHTDGNKDNKCDTCGAKMKAAAAPTTTQKTNAAPAGNTTTATKGDGSAATTTTAAGDTNSTESVGDAPSQVESDSPTDDSSTDQSSAESDSSVPEQDSVSGGEPVAPPADGSPIKTIVIVAGAAVLVSGLGVGIFFLIKKR